MGQHNNQFVLHRWTTTTVYKVQLGTCTAANIQCWYQWEGLPHEFNHAANIWDKAKQCSLAYRMYDWHWHCVGRTGGYPCSTRSWLVQVYWVWSEMTSQKCPVWASRVMCAYTVTAHIIMVQSHCLAWTSWTEKVKSWWQGCHHQTAC